jgi:hypothetical protein
MDSSRVSVKIPPSTIGYINPKGETMSQDVAEIWTVAGNKLGKLTIYFDLTAYRNFMRG